MHDGAALLPAAACAKTLIYNDSGEESHPPNQHRCFLKIHPKENQPPVRGLTPTSPPRPVLTAVMGHSY